jgi:hypothetical protein
MNIYTWVATSQETRKSLHKQAPVEGVFRETLVHGAEPAFIKLIVAQLVTKICAFYCTQISLRFLKVPTLYSYLQTAQISTHYVTLKSVLVSCSDIHLGL